MGAAGRAVLGGAAGRAVLGSAAGRAMLGGAAARVMAADPFDRTKTIPRRPELGHMRVIREFAFRARVAIKAGLLTKLKKVGGRGQ